jgi:hypothetical protein
MKQLNDEALIALCIMVGFALILATISGMFYTDMRKQSLYKQTYNKAMECRIAYKDREQPYVDNVCGKVPNIKDFVK